MIKSRNANALSTEHFLGAMYLQLLEKALRQGQLSKDSFEQLLRMPHRELDDLEKAYNALLELVGDGGIKRV